MKVYVLLLWFYDGDSNLVNSFKGAFSSYDIAVKEKDDIDHMGCEIVSSTESEAREYQYGGKYGDPSYFEVYECHVLGQSEELVCECMPDPKCRVENNTVVCNGCNKERR